MTGLPRSCTAAVQRLAIMLVLALAGCHARAPEPATTSGEAPTTEASSCPTEQLHESHAPDVRPEHETAAFWLAPREGIDHDAALLDADARTQLAARVAELPGGWRDPLSEAGTDPALIDSELSERLAFLRERMNAGKYVEGEPGMLERAAARIALATVIAGPNLRFVAAETPLWCVPSSAGLYTTPIDRDFDRNRCASLHPGELVRALRVSPDDDRWIYVDAGHSVGWIDARDGESLEAPLDVTAARARLDATPRAWLIDDAPPLRAGSNFPLRNHGEHGWTLLVPGVDGPIERTLAADAPVREQPFELTRRALFEQAFALLGQPYGWGGRDGQRDCSRYLLDLFAQFDIRMPRNSAVQAQLGTHSVDLSDLDEDAKRAAIREAARAGVVLLYMPGHIMLYLGQDGGRDYGISALSEYLTPCPGGPDTVHRLDRVAVTTLDVGRGTERRAFIERITRMAIFGPAPAGE